MLVIFLAILPLIVSCVEFDDTLYYQYSTAYPQLYWTLLTLSAVLLGVGILLYIHACLLRMKDEQRYIVYEAAPLLGTKMPPPNYEQVV